MYHRVPAPGSKRAINTPQSTSPLQAPKPCFAPFCLPRALDARTWRRAFLRHRCLDNKHLRLTHIPLALALTSSLRVYTRLPLPTFWLRRRLILCTSCRRLAPGHRRTGLFDRARLWNRRVGRRRRGPWPLRRGAVLGRCWRRGHSFAFGQVGKRRRTWDRYTPCRSLVWSWRRWQRCARRWKRLAAADWTRVRSCDSRRLTLGVGVCIPVFGLHTCSVDGLVSSAVLSSSCVRRGPLILLSGEPVACCVRRRVERLIERLLLCRVCVGGCGCGCGDLLRRQIFLRLGSRMAASSLQVRSRM